MSILRPGNHQQRELRRDQRQQATLDNVEKVYQVALRTVPEYWQNWCRRKRLAAEPGPRSPDQPPKKQETTLVNMARLLVINYGMSVLVEVPT